MLPISATKIAGEVKDFDIERFMPRRQARRLDRYAQFFWVSAQEALDDAGLAYEEDDPEALRAGVVLGTGIGGVETVRVGARHAARRVGSGRGSVRLAIPKIISNMAGGVVSIDFHLYGPNTHVVTACAASANAIGDAAEIIRRR